MVDAHMGIGLAYYDLGEWDRAIEAFGRSLAQCTEDTHDNAHVLKSIAINLLHILDVGLTLNKSLK